MVVVFFVVIILPSNLCNYEMSLSVLSPKVVIDGGSSCLLEEDWLLKPQKLILGNWYNWDVKHKQGSRGVEPFNHKWKPPKYPQLQRCRLKVLFQHVFLWTMVLLRLTQGLLNQSQSVGMQHSAVFTTCYCPSIMLLVLLDHVSSPIGIIM